MKALAERSRVNSLLLSLRPAVVLSLWLSSGSGFNLPLFTSSIRPRRPPSGMMASRNADDALTNAAPIYITVGPQCCGKSTFLKEHHPDVLDISLDDQRGVYIPIKTSTFLSAINSTSKEGDMECLDEFYQGRTLRNRIRQDNTELNLILRHWSGELSLRDFAMQLFQFYQEKEQPMLVAQSLVRAIQETEYELPEHVQVFIVESLFRPHSSDNLSAIQRAYKRLRTTPSHIPVAWGNTNSKPRDYQMALEIACQTRRPVHIFLASPDGPFPSLSLSMLLARSLQRLSESGKYVPAVTIADCLQRIEGLVAQTSGMDAFAKEQHLVQLAEPPHPRNNKNNNDTTTTTTTTSTYRYRLTRNRLIQKEFFEPQNPSSRAYQERQRTSSSSSSSVGRRYPREDQDSRKRSSHAPPASSLRWNQTLPQQQNGYRNFENDRREPTHHKRPRINPNSQQYSSSQNNNSTRPSQSRGPHY